MASQDAATVEPARIESTVSGIGAPVDGGGDVRGTWGIGLAITPGGLCFAGLDTCPRRSDVEAPWQWIPQTPMNRPTSLVVLMVLPLALHVQEAAATDPTPILEPSERLL